MALPKSKSSAAPLSTVAKKTAAAAQPTAAPRKTTGVSKKNPAVVERAPAPADIVKKAEKKEKCVRASFSIAKAQIVALSELKARCLRMGVSAKKGEVLAAAIQLLANMPEASFTELILPYLNTDQKVPNGKMRRK